MFLADDLLFPPLQPFQWTCVSDIAHRRVSGSPRHPALDVEPPTHKVIDEYHAADKPCDQAYRNQNGSNGGDGANKYQLRRMYQFENAVLGEQSDENLESEEGGRNAQQSCGAHPRGPSSNS